MNRTRIFLVSISVLSLVLTTLLFLSVRKARSQSAALEEVDRLVAFHCRDLSLKLRDAEQNVRQALQSLQNPGLSPEEREAAEARAYTSLLGEHALIGDARTVLTGQLVPQGYFCIRAGHVPEQERSQLDSQLTRQTQMLVSAARDPAAMADALAKLSEIFGRVGPKAGK